jgi:hypothetical protein
MSPRPRRISSLAVPAFAVSLIITRPETAAAQEPAPAAQPEQVGSYLKDRGSGLPTSLFGTYIRQGEWILYPFFEGYRDDDFEYSPEELGHAGDLDYRGRYRASEALFFLGYGLTENLAFEVEIAAIKAQLDKAADDVSTVPTRLEEAGLGDVEGQLRYRWRRETETRPEIFSYFEMVVPHHRDKPLIGTGGWEYKFGTGLVRGYSWGTITARAAVEYENGSTSEFDIGEYAFEYLKRLSPSWRIYLGLEGTQDELELITEAQWHLSRNLFVRFNNGLGLTSKATDWAPEIGVVIAVPTRRTPNR